MSDSPVKDPSLYRLDRRQLALMLSRGVAAMAVPGALGGGLARALAGSDIAVPAWIPDIDGDGVVTEQDVRLVEAAMATRRGDGLLPAAGFDHRADLFGRGRVGSKDLEAVQALLGASAGPGRRPVTVAWHYTWYHKRRRLAQTASFHGGDYLSADPDVEHVFNRLKNEFGISVDALSWISPRVDPRVLQNLNRGFFRARSLPSRHVALLYESTINLPHAGPRIDFTSADVHGSLVQDFERMASMLRHHEANSGARLFRLDGRPVVFVYGSHTWLIDPDSGYEVFAFEHAVKVARDAFADIAGQPPFLVGEELPLAPDDVFSADRKRRASNFDALFRYHHVSSPWNIIHGGHRLGPAYAGAQQSLLDRNRTTIGSLLNRFTGQPVDIIPSLAAGFAKKGMRKLFVTRDSYAAYLAEMRRWHDSWLADHRVELPRWLNVPIYTVGSWNEEFEGHCLFPFTENASVPRPTEDGFDLVMALKQNFGWNHYAQRDIL